MVLILLVHVCWRKVPLYCRNLYLLYSIAHYFKVTFLLTGRMPMPLPFTKKADKSMQSNYRPISFLSQIGKAMERFIHKHLYNYISENNLLTPFQSGFIQGDSTTFQLLHTYHSFLEALDSGKELRVVFCNISKAFDRVWHRGLLHKLAVMGLSEGRLRLFKSYLSNRRQRVVLNGVESN